MQRKTIFFVLNLLTVISGQCLFAQSSSIEKTNGSVIGSTSAIFLNDLFKQPYKQNVDPDIKGSPFLIDEWKYADLILTGGKRFDRVKVKLNLFSQELIYLAAGNNEITLKDGIIGRMILYDSSGVGLLTVYQFISGIPFVEKDTIFPFFELIVDGKAMLLNYYKKRVTDTKDALAQSGGKEFINSESLFVFMNNELKKCEKGSDFFIELFKDKKEAVENFIKLQKLKCRNRDDVIKLIQYYNSL